MEKEHLVADSKLIKWLLFESEEKKSTISKGANVPYSTVSDLKAGKSSIERMLFENASKLTAYAATLKKIDLE